MYVMLATVQRRNEMEDDCAGWFQRVKEIVGFKNPASAVESHELTNS